MITITDDAPKENEVRQLREEIDWIKSAQSIFYSTPSRAAARKRIIARLEELLAAKSAGLKEKP